MAPAWLNTAPSLPIASTVDSRVPNRWLCLYNILIRGDSKGSRRPFIDIGTTGDVFDDSSIGPLSSFSVQGLAVDDLNPSFLYAAFERKTCCAADDSFAEHSATCNKGR